MNEQITELRFFVKVYAESCLYILSKTPVKRLEQIINTVFPLGSCAHIFPESDFSNFAEGCLVTEIIEGKLVFCLLTNPDTKALLSLEEFIKKIPSKGCYMILKRVAEPCPIKIKVIYKNAIRQNREATFDVFWLPKSEIDQKALASNLISEKLKLALFEVVNVELIQ